MSQEDRDPRRSVGDGDASEFPYATFPVADADSHLMETAGWLSAYVDEPARSQLLGLDLTCAGSTAALDVAQLGMRARATVAPPLEDLLTTKAWRAFGAVDAHERSLALDRLGFERQLIFSTLSTSQVPQADVSTRYDCYRGLNEGIAAFCDYDDRLLPVGYVPLEDPDLAVEHVVHAISVGCHAILLPFSPPPHAPSHPMYDDFWREVEDARVPVVFHLGFGSQHVSPKLHDNGIQSTDFLGSERSLRAKDAVVAHHGLETLLSCMVLDGLFDRFPDVRIACMEFGAGWVPDWLRRLDMMTKYGATEPAVRDLHRRPSQYVLDQMLFCPQPDEDIGRLLTPERAHMFAFASDFPHPEGSDDPIGLFAASMTDVDEQGRSGFFRENFRRVFEARSSTDRRHAQVRVEPVH